MRLDKRKQKICLNKSFAAFLLLTIGVFLMILEFAYSKLNYFSEGNSILLVIFGILGFVFMYCGGIIYFLARERKNYRASWKFIKESRRHILFVIALLAVSGIIGMFFQPALIIELIKKMIEELVAKTDGLNYFEMLWFIFQNNSGVALMSIVFGVFFGLFPLITTFFNGYVLGFVSGKAVELGGFSQILKLLPHGIFELPAIILALAFGLRLGMFIFADKPGPEFRYRLKNALRVLVFVIVPLLIFAAIIETSLIFIIK